MRTDYTQEQMIQHLLKAADAAFEAEGCYHAPRLKEYLTTHPDADRDEIWFKTRCDANCGNCPMWLAILDVVEE